jgi:hypothetical protein
MRTSRKNLGGLLIVIAAAIPPAPAAAQFVTLEVSPIPATQRLIERQVQDVAFTFKLQPGKNGRRVPKVNYPIEMLVCAGETSTNCVAFDGLTPTVSKSGTLPLRLPLGGPAVAIQLVACEAKRDANGVGTCGRVYGRAEFTHAIFARFEVGIDSFTIKHARAPNDGDTLYLGYAGLFANNAVDAATLNALDACDNIIGVASVEKPMLCRNQARFGTEDLRDGTHPGRKDLGVGIFEVIPGTGGQLNFGFVLFNFGFPGEPSDARDLMIGNSHNAIRGQLVRQSGQFGVLEIVNNPLPDITHNLNTSPWLGCDGPTAGGVFSIPNDNSSGSLDALTSGSGQKSIPTKEYVVDSQALCGESSRYSVVWFVRRTTW